MLQVGQTVKVREDAPISVALFRGAVGVVLRPSSYWDWVIGFPNGDAHPFNERELEPSD